MFLFVLVVTGLLDLSCIHDSSLPPAQWELSPDDCIG